MKITIIEASLNELIEIAPLFNEYRQFYQQADDLSLAVNFIRQRLEHHQSVILLARTAAGKPVGFTQLYPSFSSVSAQPIWILNDLYVSDNCRGLGVGKALLNQAKQHALNTKAMGISLQTSSDNLQAQSLYESLGYQQKHDFYHYFLNLIDS